MTFPIYYDDNGTQNTFHDIVLRKATFDNVIMSLGRKISGDFLWIDNTLEFSMREYVVFNDVKYYIVNPPTVVRNGLVKDNSDTKGATRYTVDFYHPEYALSSLPFEDIAVSDDEKIYLSQNKTFSWIGNLQDFVAKLNKNLQETEWICRINADMSASDERLNKLSEVLSFDDQMISDALKTAYDTWGIPFVTFVLESTDEDYSELKKYAIEFGLPTQEIIVDNSGTLHCDTYLAGQELFYHPQAITLAKGTTISLVVSDNAEILLDGNLNVMGVNTYTATENGEEIYVGHGGTAADVSFEAYDIPFVFECGKGLGLKNNSATPKNNKIVTRLSGYGSEDNIPYGYPQIIWQGSDDADFTIGDSTGVKENVTINGHTYAKAVSYPIYKGIVGGQYVKLIKHPFTRTTLMPPIYEETIDKKVNPYNEEYDPDIEIVDYYDAPNDYPNPINVETPSYEIHQFEDIKPRLWADGEKQISNAFPYDNGNETDYMTLSEFETFISQKKASLIVTGQNGNQYVLDPTEYALLQRIFTDVYQGNELDIDWKTDMINSANSYTCTYIYDSEKNWVKVTHVSKEIEFTVNVLRSGFVPTVEWNDDMNDDGEYIQSYFKITLPPLGFDLYACASITQEMKINMRSGACIGCTFTIQCDWEDYKNTFYDENGDFAPQGTKRLDRIDDYPDSTSQSITVIVQKDVDTFGTLMPNIYQQPVAGDSFVILGISLPLSYIRNAQEELRDAMMEYILENNVYYYDYPLSFDEKFLYDHTNILNQIDNNKLVRFRYGNILLGLYIKQITITFGENALPSYSITLTDDVELVMNQLGQTTEDVSQLRVQVSQISKYYGGNTNGNYASLQKQLDQKLSKEEEDVAKERITFEKGLTSNGKIIVGDDIHSDNYNSSNDSGIGRGWNINKNGNAAFESVTIRSVLEVNELRVNRQQAQEGDTIFSDNDQIIAVEEAVKNNVTYYKLSFKAKWEGYISAQIKGNVLKGVINTLSANQANVIDASEYSNTEMDKTNSYYVSFMKVTDDHTTDSENLLANQVYVVLYDDSAVPSGHNFPPCELMNVCRWGYDTNIGVLTDEDEIALRQRSFHISAKDGRLTKFIGVNKPIIDNWMYGTTLGVLPDFVKRMASVASRISEDPNRDYLYSQGVVVEDFIKVDNQGRPLINYVDKGNWDVSTTYLFESWDSNDRQYETHEVWYNGEKWRCIETNTGHTPVANSLYWLKILTKGTNGTSVNIKGNVVAVVQNYVDLPTGSSVASESLGIVITENTIYRFNGSIWGASGITVANYDAYINNADGQLYMWNGNTWNDLGRIKGDDGKGIANITSMWLATTLSSGVTKSTIGWSSTPQNANRANPYLWNYIIVTYTDNSVQETSPLLIGNWSENGDFKSTCFKRTNDDISSTIPTGGSYGNPIANGWNDGIPSGESQLWATTCTFYGAGGNSGWSTPRKMTDTFTSDIEFAKEQPNGATPATPTDANRHGGSGTQVWFDPDLDSEQDFTTMHWMAERECKNGVWGNWVITKIKGEQGENGDDAVAYSLAPTATSLSFGYSGGAYTPVSQEISFGYEKVEGDTREVVTGNFRKQDGAPYNMLWHIKMNDGTRLPTSGWWWMYDPRTSQSTRGCVELDDGVMTVYGNSDLASIEVILTSTTSSSGVTDQNTVARVSVPITRDGIKGDNGKMGRNYYYKGNWEDYSTTSPYETFVVSDYETPYFMYDGNFWVWIGNNGTYQIKDENMPSNENENWQIMVSDFEYLITKATFSDFGKFGSWIFNGDYMFSDEGRDSNGNSYGFSDGGRFYGNDSPRNTYTPNTAIDAMTGKIVTRAITLEGVLNNLILEINNNNIGNYGNYDSTFYINPLKVGSYVRIDMNGATLPIHLPTARSTDGNAEHYQVTGVLGTLDEVRQCVGKKIHFIPVMKVVENQTSGTTQTLTTNLQFNDSNSLLLHKVTHYDTLTDLDSMAINVSFEKDEEISRTSSITGYGDTIFFVAECKVGNFKGHECIYWEVESSTECLRDPITIIET